MKRGLKVFVSLLLVAVIAIPSILATELGTSSQDVTLNEIYDYSMLEVDIEWGSLVYNYVVSIYGESSWVPVMEGADTIHVTNYSNQSVNVNIYFNSNITSVTGENNLEQSGWIDTMYLMLTDKPVDWDVNTSNYFSIDSNKKISRLIDGTEYENNKYFRSSSQFISFLSLSDHVNILGVAKDKDINGNDMYETWTKKWVLELNGNALNELVPGAKIGTVNVVLS